MNILRKAGIPSYSNYNCQLSNTLFKDKSTNIRRFSKLINSVIIIDEVQSLPTKVIYNFNLMTNF